MEYNSVTCYIDQTVTCKNTEVITEEPNVFYLVISARTPVVFIHSINKLPICQGWGFQIHVWGDEKYTIWVLNEGRVPCLVLNGVYVDICGDNVYALSSKHAICSILSLTPCEVELAELLKLLKYPLFVLVDYSRNVPLINVVNHANVVECTEKKNRLFNVLRG